MREDRKETGLFLGDDSKTGFAGGLAFLLLLCAFLGAELRQLDPRLGHSPCAPQRQIDAIHPWVLH